jgi:hypothetical protein
MASPPTSHSPMGWAASSSESAPRACCGGRRERHEAKPGERACAHPPWHRRSEQGSYGACVGGLTLGVSRALGGGKARHCGQASAHPGDCSFFGSSGARSSGAPSVCDAPPFHKRRERGDYGARIGGCALDGSRALDGLDDGGTLPLGGRARIGARISGGALGNVRGGGALGSGVSFGNVALFGGDSILCCSRALGHALCGGGDLRYCGAPASAGALGGGVALSSRGASARRPALSSCSDCELRGSSGALGGACSNGSGGTSSGPCGLCRALRSGGANGGMLGWARLSTCLPPR